MLERIRDIRASEGIPTLMWLDDNGITFKEESLMGLTMERVRPEQALQKATTKKVDLLGSYEIAAIPAIQNHEHLNQLTLQVEGLDPAMLRPLQSKRQKVIKDQPLTISLHRLPTPGSSNLAQKYTKASAIIQSEHPRIKDQAKIIIRAKKDDWSRTWSINEWVYGYLNKRPTMSLSSAVEILDAGIGDCTEHTVLFTSLSRASGIPTKIHVGLVYLKGRFLLHAWPVVFISGEWVDVDPSLNQFPADVTHLALLEGDFVNLTELIPLLGRIKINVLEQAQ